MELKSSAPNRFVESFSCPSKEFAVAAIRAHAWNAVSAGSIQIENKGTPPSSCSGAQIRYSVVRVAKLQKVSASVRIVLSAGETHLSSSRRQRSRKAENNL